MSNRNIRCVIIDDEPLAVKLLENFVERTPWLTLQASYTDPIKAMTEIDACPPDLIFLDIQMPDINGMELARLVSSDTRIIFTTAFKDYAFDSYEVNALDFLLKPIRYVKFVASVEKAREWFDLKENASKTIQESTTSQEGSGRDTYTFIRVDGELKRIDFGDIIMVKGLKDYVMFYLHSQQRALIVHMTMKAAEDLLPSSTFMRINRSYIVALDQIKKIDRNDCVYIHDEIIHVTEAYKPAFDAFLNK